MSTLTSTAFRAPRNDAPGLLARAIAMFAVKPSAPKPSADPIEAYINANGGVLTDQLERDISRRYGTIVGS